MCLEGTPVAHIQPPQGVVLTRKKGVNSYEITFLLPSQAPHAKSWLSLIARISVLSRLRRIYPHTTLTKKEKVPTC